MEKHIKKPKSVLKNQNKILFICKIISTLSTRLTVVFAIRLFTTPIRHKIPKREVEMDSKCIQYMVKVPSINKNVMIYKLGKSSKKVLLVHGWSGRGTQLYKFSDTLIKSDYSIISFDAPAHGKSSGNKTLMTEFIETILVIDQKFGPFEAAIGHSLGGMSLLNAVRNSLQLKKLVIIGSGDIVKDIMDDFVGKLRLESKISDLMRKYIEKKSDKTMDSFSSSVAAKYINIPVLIIHDEYDDEVPIKCAININYHLKNGELFLTKNLGHRKILGDPKVIAKALQFIEN